LKIQHFEVSFVLAKAIFPGGRNSSALEPECCLFEYYNFSFEKIIIPNNNINKAFLTHLFIG
jgi:hypothetical protein